MHNFRKTLPFISGVIPKICSNELGLYSNCVRNQAKQSLHTRRAVSGPLFGHQVQHVSTVETKPVQSEEGLLKRMIQKIPFLSANKSKIAAAGYLLYESIADRIDYADFFYELYLPDTFYSWFAVTELHVWMLSARAMAEGDDGRLLRNYLVEALWSDVNQRTKKLGASNPAVMRMQVAQLSEQFQAALIAYDEGIQSEDIVLAGALWRRFYQQEDFDPRHLEILVKYVRKQMKLLDCLSKDQLFRKKAIPWIQLDE